MIVEAAAIIAGAILLLTGGILWAAFHVVASFGQYEAATIAHTKQQGKVMDLLFAIHESNQMLAGQNAKMLEALKRAKSNGHQQGAA